MTSLSFDWTKIKMLIVEDHQEMLEVLCDFFRSQGAAIYSAANGLEAFQIIETLEIDFVLSDVQMPVMNGTELLRKIRERDPEIPVVLLATGFAELTEGAAVASGAAGLIHKPFDFSNLLDKISAVLMESQAARILTSKIS